MTQKKAPKKKTTKKTPKKKTPPEPKTRQDWIDAGLSALAERGADAVKVEVLAQRLGVTKGSFYWHFADRPALLTAMLEHWELIATDAIMVAVDAGGGAPGARLARLIEMTTTHRTAAALESALRAWGRADTSVSKALSRVDGRREGYVRDLLEAHGLAPALASTGSHVLYLSLIGEYACVAHGVRPTAAAVWRTLLAVLLGTDAWGLRGLSSQTAAADAQGSS